MVDDIIFLMMIVVSGCCIFELVLIFKVMGRKFSEVIRVVINIGCRWLRVLLWIVLFSGLFCLCRWWMKVIMISLLSIVMFDSVMKLMLVEIDSGILCRVSVSILLVSVSGMLLNMMVVFLVELKVMNSRVKINVSVIGMIMLRCWVVEISCLKVLL